MEIEVINHSFGPLVESNGFSFREARHLVPFEMPKHEHDGAELALMFEGHVSAKWKGGSTIAGPQTLAFLPPATPHSSAYLSEVHAFYLGINPQAWNRTGAQMPNLDQVQEYDRSVELQFAKALHMEYLRKDSVACLMLEGIMLQLLESMSGKIDRIEDLMTPRWLLRAKDYLHEHAVSEIRMSTVAEIVGVHPGHLMRAFHQHFGETVGNYVRRIRVEIACARIVCLEAEQTLGALAAELGFSDQTQFCRTFKRVTGQTPLQFRNSKTC